MLIPYKVWHVRHTPPDPWTVHLTLHTARFKQLITRIHACKVWAYLRHIYWSHLAPIVAQKILHAQLDLGLERTPLVVLGGGHSSSAGCVPPPRVFTE